MFDYQTPMQFLGTTSKTEFDELSIHARYVVKFEAARLKWLLKCLGRSALEEEIMSVHRDYYGPYRLSFAAFHAIAPGFPFRIIAWRPEKPFLPDASFADAFRHVSWNPIFRYYHSRVIRCFTSEELNDPQHREHPVAVVFPYGGIRGGLVLFNRILEIDGSQMLSNSSGQPVRSIARFNDFAEAVIRNLEDEQPIRTRNGRVIPAIDDGWTGFGKEPHDRCQQGPLTIPRWVRLLTQKISQRLVLSCIAEVTTRQGRHTANLSTSADGSLWWITKNSDIAQWAGLETRTVRQAIKDLEAAGFVDRDAKRFQGNNRLYVRVNVGNVNAALALVDADQGP